MKPITKQSYGTLATSSKSMIIYFHAPWCSPCRKLKPLLDKIEASYFGTPLEFYSCDCDESGGQDLAGDFRIMAIPALILIKAGKEYDRIIGVGSESEIREKIEKMMCGGG